MGIPHSSETVFKAYVSHKANEANKYGFQFSTVQSARLEWFRGVVHCLKQAYVVYKNGLKNAA